MRAARPLLPYSEQKMSKLNIRRVIGTALSACRYTAWVAVWTDGTRGVTEIVTDAAADAAELETIARSEHRVFLHGGQGVHASRSRSRLGGYAHGVTLVCGGEKEWRLLVMVLRGDGLGRFTEPEVKELQDAANTIASEPSASHRRSGSRPYEHPLARIPGIFSAQSALRVGSLVDAREHARG